MREILFKAIRVDNGEWIEGQLVADGEKHYWIVYDFDFYETKQITAKALASDRYAEVQPETVCQYTGLTDKVGRKVFEWDIIRYPGGAEYEVFFDDEFTSFRANNGTDIHFINGEEITEVEVIGTKFDVEEKQ